MLICKRKEKKKKKKKVSGTNDVATDMTQQGRNNNKCYASIFKYIYIYIYRYIDEILFYKWKSHFII